MSNGLAYKYLAWKKWSYGPLFSGETQSRSLLEYLTCLCYNFNTTAAALFCLLIINWSDSSLALIDSALSWMSTHRYLATIAEQLPTQRAEPCSHWLCIVISGQETDKRSGRKRLQYFLSWQKIPNAAPRVLRLPPLEEASCLQAWTWLLWQALRLGLLLTSILCYAISLLLCVGHSLIRKDGSKLKSCNLLYRL